MAVAVTIALGAVAPGCGCSVTGGEGDKAVDVTMGGHLMTDTLLSFKATGYANQQLWIENTASEHPLPIGPGTPIRNADGSVAAQVQGHDISIPPGGTGILALTAPLQIGRTYYLGANSSGKPSIRQMFICPGSPPSGTGGGGGYVPPIPQDTQSFPTE
jgi:hypothetical protein